jgi:hypothetical protein
MKRKKDNSGFTWMMSELCPDDVRALLGSSELCSDQTCGRSPHRGFAIMSGLCPDQECCRFNTDKNYKKSKIKILNNDITTINQINHWKFQHIFNLLIFNFC